MGSDIPAPDSSEPGRSSSVRMQRLYEVVDKALDDTLAGLGGPTEFTKRFKLAGVERKHVHVAYSEAMARFRQNVKEEVSLALDESNTAAELRRLDALIRMQPALKDGKRCIMPSRVSPGSTLEHALADERAKHKRKLQSMLDELQAGNGEIEHRIERTKEQMAQAEARVCELFA